MMQRGNCGKAGAILYIIATAVHSIFLEMALSQLEKNGIHNSHVLVVPLSLQSPATGPSAPYFQDADNVLDGGAVFATVFMVMGVIYGMVWPWGPIIWGLIGLAGGFLFGCLLKYGLTRKHNGQDRLYRGKYPGVVLLVHCRPFQTETVKAVLIAHHILDIGEYQPKG